MPTSITEHSTFPLRLVVSICAGVLAFGGWATSIHYQLLGLNGRLDAIYQAVSDLRADQNEVVQRENLLYWIGELRSRNPQIEVPAYPRAK